MSARHADDFPHCRRQPEGKPGCNVNYAVSNGSKKPLHVPPVLPQVSLSQAILIDRAHNRPQQLTKGGGEGFEVLVPRIGLDIVVEIPDEVDQALLLRTRQRVVRAVEIGDEHPVEVAE